MTLCSKKYKGEESVRWFRKRDTLITAGEAWRIHYHRNRALKGSPGKRKKGAEEREVDRPVRES